MRKTGSTRTARWIAAPIETVFRAFLDPQALQSWMAPGDMVGRIHAISPRVGGGYEMSLFYSSSQEDARGKTSPHEDRFTSKFIEIDPPRRIVQMISFDTSDPELLGEMTMEVLLEDDDLGTTVTIAFENIPPGIRPEDNDLGTRSSLEKSSTVWSGRSRTRRSDAEGLVRPIPK